ncbi:hypothetical protein I5R65_19335 [Herbaspirillum sp. AP02]|uniref:hypothetical protein n=1 Tax=unclassified Herbaspirillum TaxID=2624150 RepID=UPI0015DAB292|nr:MULTISPECIES: hypothetical protein [unclassified Herbaspirillum]MBG7621629.1 hypothetical protein [Herbaspirillum sp. AP02]NZD69716.1 hypothetical protein [Herbaspirillum sp. AP21]
MSTMNPALKYAHRLRDLALQASAGEDMIEKLHFALSDAKLALGGSACTAVVACQQHLLSFMRDTTDGDSAVMYNAVLNWAIRGLGQD